MSVMYGADADELERIASEFRRTADELDGEGSALTGILNRVAWLGDVATRYLDNWTGVQIPKIGLSTQFLREAADTLERNARDQRETSAGSTGTLTPVAPVPQPGPANPDEIRIPEWIEDLLGELGLTTKVMKEIYDTLLNAIPISMLEDLEFLKDIFSGPLGEMIKVFGDVLDVGNIVVDVLSDMADHSHLDPVERTIHAIVDTAARVAVAQGAEWVGSALGGVIGSAIPVGGTALGVIIGKAAGMAIGEGIEMGVDLIDEHHDVYDTVADGAVEAWRKGVELYELGHEIVDGATEIAEDIVNAGVEGIRDVGGAIIDIGEDVGGAIIDVGEGIGGFIGGWL